MAATLVELERRQSAGMEQTDAGFVVAGKIGTHAGGLDDAAHAPAIQGGKAARVNLDGIHQARIQQAHRAQEILEVERLGQTQAIQYDGSLIRLPATNLSQCGEAVVGHTGQARHCPKRFIRQARHAL